MKELKINTAKINLVAAERGMSAEKYVSRIVSLSFGQKVCAHFVESHNGESIFKIKKCAHTI